MLPHTNLLLDSQGLRFAWNYETSVKSRKFYWEDMEFLHSVKLKSEVPGIADGDMVTMKFKLNNLSLKQRLAVKAQLKLLQSYENRGFLFDDLLSNRELYLQIPLDMFTLEADRMRFTSALSEWAPEQVISDDFKEFAGGSTAPTYTQLWLDDMQSYKRKRVESLEADSLLQDGRFTVLEKIASGGQAQIYLAMDSHESKKVVLKEFVLPVSAGNEVRNRSFKSVKTEALLLASLDHPGIVRLYDQFVEDHRAYLVLEHIEGKSLRQYISESGKLDSDSVKKLLKQLCQILDYLHTQAPPLVHRDFTPANLVLTSGEQIKLIDFNVAHLMESDNTKTVVGKHCYMAPEQFKGKPCPQSDLYSLGCTLFYMLTGKDPTPLSQSFIESQYRVEDDLVELVSRLTMKSSDDRIQSASEILVLLESRNSKQEIASTNGDDLASSVSQELKENIE